NGRAYGTRIGADGSILDPSGLAISPPGQPARSLTIAANGSKWFVMWPWEFDARFWDGNGSEYGGEQDGGVNAAFVASDGTVENPEVASYFRGYYGASPGLAGLPTIASDGSGFLVAESGSEGPLGTGLIDATGKFKSG